MQLTNIEMYKVFQNFRNSNLYFDDGFWFYETEGMRIPISRTLLEDFARTLLSVIDNAKETIRKAKQLVIEREAES